MSQSNAIFGALFIAFIVFVTVRGELPTYINLLRGNTTTVVNGNTSNVQATSSNSVVSEANTIEEQAQNLLGADPGIQLSGTEFNH